jgi:hypothetical protein
MRSISKLFFYVLLISFISSYSATSQGLLKRAGQKLGREAEKMLDKDKSKNSNSDNNNQNNPNQNVNQNPGGEAYPGGGASQTRTSSTGRKKMTPPDVNKSMTDAETAFKSKDYNDTRFNIQQALTGIELEIGYQMLDSMPKNIDGLDYKDEDDQVLSTGYGFAGFNVARSWRNKDDKSMNVSIMNNAAMSSSYNMILTNPGYMNSSNNNQKTVKVGTYRAVLTAEENGSFSLGIPLGQSSLIAMTFQDYKDEDEVIHSAQQLNIDGIKTMLGEQ